MPQVIEYSAVSGKRWEWHLVLFKEWLRVVEEGPTERKYVKWLRARKVFDRGFVEFVERFIGIDHPRKQAPTLNDVAIELLEELSASEKRALEVTEKVLERGPGRDMPAPPPPPPSTSAGGLRGRRGAAELEEVDPESYAPPTAETDPFLKALLERFTELNPYLSMFVFKQIGDDFMAPGELYRRVGSNDFEGRRPTMPMFNQFLQWLEWLGGLKKVGFRHKATQAGIEVGAFLAAMPLDELLEPDEEHEPAADDATTATTSVATTTEAGAVGAAAAPAAAPPAEDAPRARADDGDDLEDEGSDDRAEDDEDADLEDDDEEEPEEFDDEELGELGLDLPPEAEVAPDAERFWKAPEPAPRPPSLLELGRELAALRGDEPSPSASPSAGAQAETPASPQAEDPTGEAETADPPATDTPASPQLGPRSNALAADSKAAPSPRPSAARNGARAADTARASAPAPAPAAGGPGPIAAGPLPARGELATRDALRLAVHWWLDNPPELEPAATSGVFLAPHPSGRPLGVFKLLALATLLEAEAAPGAARSLFRALERAQVLEALLLEDAPLERALEVAWREQAPQALEERLVHLVRYRRGLLALGDALPREGDARELARTLRAQVTGPTLGPGLLFVLRELTAAGQGPATGLEAVAWLPGFPLG